MSNNFDWKHEITSWIKRKKNLKNYTDDILTFFEMSFMYAFYPDRSFFGTNSYSISLLTGNIYFAAYTNKIWMLLDKKIDYLPHSNCSEALSSKSFEKPLYWLDTSNLENLKLIISDNNIWESYKTATKLIFQNTIVTAYRKNLNNKRLLSDFYTMEIENNYIYTPENIIWIKNVTDKNKNGAYLDLHEGQNTFELHFPNHSGKNIKNPCINDIILLYQIIDNVKVFTHLVTPIDNEIVSSNREKYKNGRNVKIIAIADINKPIKVSDTLFENITLSGVTQGNACRIENMKNITNIAKIQLDIWQKFSGQFIESEKESEIIVTSIIDEIENYEKETTNRENTKGENEGETKLITHLVKERNKKIILRKKEDAKLNNKLFCQICGFSFIKTFKKEFIECHHITPISKSNGRIETKLDDLALVCPNCHRMLHVKFDNEYLSIEDLKKLIDKNKQD